MNKQTAQLNYSEAIDETGQKLPTVGGLFNLLRNSDESYECLSYVATDGGRNKMAHFTV